MTFVIFWCLLESGGRYHGSVGPRFGLGHLTEFMEDDDDEERNFLGTLHGYRPLRRAAWSTSPTNGEIGDFFLPSFVFFSPVNI